MAISTSGAVISGMCSPFLINGGKRSGLVCGAVRFGRKNVIFAPQWKKSCLPLAAVKGHGDSKLDPEWLDETSHQAGEYMKEKGSEVGHLSAQKGQEAKDYMERAKDFILEKTCEAIDNVAENAQKASDFVAEIGEETKREAVSVTEKAKDFIVEKVGEANETATDMSKKTAKYVAEKAAEAKEAILPPKE